MTRQVSVEQAECPAQALGATNMEAMAMSPGREARRATEGAAGRNSVSQGQDVGSYPEAGED